MHENKEEKFQISSFLLCMIYVIYFSHKKNYLYRGIYFNDCEKTIKRHLPVIGL